MHKPRHETTHRQETIHNPEFTPKIHAKKQINFHRKPLAGQQSAYRPTRLPQRPLLSSDHGTVSLTEEVVRNSAIYRMLEEEMRVMVTRHETELAKLKEVKQEKERQLSGMKGQQYNTKMQIWELKNEAMELKESIKEEREENSRLTAELGIGREGEENSSNDD